MCLVYKDFGTPVILGDTVRVYGRVVVVQSYCPSTASEEEGKIVVVDPRTGRMSEYRAVDIGAEWIHRDG